MIKNPEEIPITYLNKGQVYTITVMDSTPPTSDLQSLRYRTYIRISFEDDEQRSSPAAYWELWKNGRGLSEAHQHDGRLLAVEYVDFWGGESSETQHPQIQLEKALFDGFCVTWMPNIVTERSPHCDILIRFNFVSTDFSYSQGVKGIPVRLCAKTEIVDFTLNSQPEVCYCKVKLFQGHGAERKLSSDVMHVKKMIGRLKQQVVQAEIGSELLDKWKISCSTTSKRSRDRSLKLSKHRRWLAELQNASENATLEENLQMKLASLMHMFSSTSPVSAFKLNLDPQDDPDLFPVYLGAAEPHDDILDQLLHQVVPESSQPLSTSPTFSCDNGNNSLNLSPQSRDLKRQSFHLYGQSQLDSMNWFSASQQDLDSRSYLKQRLCLSHPVKIRKISSQSSDPSWIEAIDVDTTYVPLTEGSKKSSMYSCLEGMDIIVVLSMI
jgi:hypothetical protein